MHYILEVLRSFFTLSEKKRLSKCIIGTTCFGEYFLFHVTNSRHYFSWKTTITVRFYSTVFLLLSFKELLCKNSVFYLHDNSTMLMPKFQNKVVSYYTSYISLGNLIFVYGFYSLPFCDCSFFFINAVYLQN